jgi:osmoprotectant transport system permease protein
VDARGMNLVLDGLRWLADPAHYQGSDAIPLRVLEHVQLSGGAVLVAALVALPIGLGLGHARRLEFVAVNVANIGRALPSLALLGFALAISIPLGLGLGFWPTFLSLIPLAIPPILTNAYVAVREVDADVVEAGRGMGLGELDILRRIEVPIGLPVIVVGLRTASVNVVATATLGAVVASGGLGRYIVDGLGLQEYDRLFAGALLVALLAIAVEAAYGLLARAAVSTGIRQGETAF